MRYFALFDGEPGAYGVAFPDLPGCTAMGDTLEEALKAGAIALADYVATVEERGGKVPAARSLDELHEDPEVTEAMVEDKACLVSLLLVRATGKSVRANLSLDEGLVAAIDAAARSRGVTRSGMVSIIVRQHLHDMG